MSRNLKKKEAPVSQTNFNVQPHCCWEEGQIICLIKLSEDQSVCSNVQRILHVSLKTHWPSRTLNKVVMHIGISSLLQKELSEPCIVLLAQLFWNSHRVNYVKKHFTQTASCRAVDPRQSVSLWSSLVAV